MIHRDKLKYVIEQLKSKEKYTEARNILDIFIETAETVADFDALGECAIIAQYHELRLRCAKFVYGNVTSSEQLFLARENLYTCYNQLNYPEQALFYIELNLKQKPNDPDTLMHKAFNLSLMGLRNEAEDIISNVSTTNNKLLESLKYTLSGKLLREGKTAEGIDGFINAFNQKIIYLKIN